MSVPAFKNARSKVRRRRSHHALKKIQLVRDPETGEFKRPHRLAPGSTAPVAVKAEKAQAPADEKKQEKKEKEQKEETQEVSAASAK